ncbi:MAG: tRNA pseudouridine(55) synthase TruB [Candidatus Nomurabacteria bacterium]|jgi:tRNA pseudouridine55 synthase|nr:tRNA pseudouridine(55) synthase TruB [Candidatus Nomurabacteria bacterium]
MQPGSVILVDKPASMTSFGVVARIRRILTEELQSKEGKGAAGFAGAPHVEGKPLVVPQKRKRLKVGHTGTLDPFATGLMVVLTGKQTKNAEKYSKLDKTYEAEIRLGQTSTTGDPEGGITAVSGTVPTKKQVEQTLSSFVGHIEQTPPVFSAIKVDGQRAYKLARAGKTPEIPKRTVNIYSIELTGYTYPVVKFTTHVSSGTYIRSLAEDIGRALGTGAYTTALRRTRVGEFSIEGAQKLIDLGIKD